jgi:hypothetical protein
MHCICITKTNQSIPFTELITVYCENHMEHINIMCRKKIIFNAKARGTYNYHDDLKG